MKESVKVQFIMKTLIMKDSEGNDMTWKRILSKIIWHQKIVFV